MKHKKYDCSLFWAGRRNYKETQWHQSCHHSGGRQYSHFHFILKPDWWKIEKYNCSLFCAGPWRSKECQWSQFSHFRLLPWGNTCHRPPWLPGLKKFEYTITNNTETKVQKANTNAQVQLQIYKHKYTNTITQIQIQMIQTWHCSLCQGRLDFGTFWSRDNLALRRLNYISQSQSWKRRNMAITLYQF